MKGAQVSSGRRTKASSQSPEALRAEISKTGAPTVPKDESVTSASTAASVGQCRGELQPDSGVAASLPPHPRVGRL